MKERKEKCAKLNVPAICFPHFIGKECTCYKILSHSNEDWKKFAATANSRPLACKWGEKCSQIDKCPYWGPGHKYTTRQTGQAFLTEGLDADNICGEANLNEATRFLFDECANMNVAATFKLDHAGAPVILGTANGANEASTGTAQVGGSTLTFVESSGKRNILSADEVLRMPHVVGYYRCSEELKIKPRDGNVIVMKDKSGTIREVELSRNEKGFPEITEEQYREIAGFGDASDVDCFWTDVVGSWQAWNKIPNVSSQKWGDEISKNTELTPQLAWSNTSGQIPPKLDGLNENAHLIFDLELDRHGDVVFVTDVTKNDKHPKYDTVRGPALAPPWKSRVVRVICSSEFPGVKVASVGPSKGRVSFRLNNCEAHLTEFENIENHDVDTYAEVNCGGVQLEVESSVVHGVATGEVFLCEAEAHVVTTRARAAQEVAPDTWIETNTEWIRTINKPAGDLFTPTAENAPFPLDSIGDTRRTVSDEGRSVIVDNWRVVGSKPLARKYIGSVSFVKLLLTGAALLAAGVNAVPNDANIARNLQTSGQPYELTAEDWQFLEELGQDQPQSDDGLSDTRRALLFRRKRNRQKLEKRVVKYVNETFSSFSQVERDLIVHTTLDHSTKLVGAGQCVVCNLAHQRRQAHSHRASDDTRDVKRRWHIDTMGKVTPPSQCRPFVGAEYGACGLSEEDDRLLFTPMRSKHSSQAKIGLTSFYHSCGSRWPDCVRTGHDSEYAGKCNDLYHEHGIHHECTLRYSPWENGNAEAAVHMCEDRGTAALVASNAPYSTWPFATAHAVDTENLARGLKLTPTSVEDPVTGDDDDDFPVRLMGPYGCQVTVVKEGAERVQGEKFQPRAWLGFHCGYAGRHSVRVGFRREDGTFDSVVTQNAKVYPNDKYFTQARGENDVFKRTTTHERESDKDTWVQVTCCSKWRQIEGSERQAMSEKNVVTCLDLGVTCDVAQDPNALENFWIEIRLGEPDFSGECYAFEGCTKKLAFNEQTEWYKSGKSYAEVMRPAVDKEFESFARNSTFNMKGVKSRSEVRREHPGAKMVLTNLIVGTKGVEHFKALSDSDRENPEVVKAALEKMKAKGRLVAYKEIFVSGGAPAPGLDPGETGISNTPSYTGIRTQIAIGLLNDKVFGDADVDTAYQKAPNREFQKSWCQLPPQLWPDDWKETFSVSDPPLVPIDGSLYGRERAACDYDFHSTSQVKLEGWKPIVDVEPCLFVKYGKNASAVKFSTPNSLSRYADDIRIAADSEDELRDEFERLGERLPFGESFKFSNGEKYVGLNSHWTKLADGRWRVVHEQKDLLRKVVNEFKTDCESRKIRFTNHRTPEPSTDTVTPMTREQENARNEQKAKVQNREDNLETLFSETCLHYVNTVAFIERGSRPDLSNAIQRLQSFGSNWTREADRLLLWVFGYLDETLNRVLVGYIDPEDLKNGSLFQLTQSDASHASQRDTRKSVAGWNIMLKGRRTSMLLDWGTKILPVVTLSSMESEVVGQLLAIKRSIPTAMTVNAFLGRISPGPDAQGEFGDEGENGLPEEYQMDALSAIMAIQKAGSTKVRHLRRTQGVSIYFMHQYFDHPLRTLKHRKGTELAADAFTKGLSFDVLIKHLRTLGIEDEGGASVLGGA